ncbi:nickel transporter [Duganella sp. Root1480D1]|uniref:HoxN/HupN/NixA family nickel/cobalt transporter n=1 Tax=Duganella sp. Root1480D1 TaxID=1736471 RepID=UPI00070CF3B2|nr:nickel transporter [Duganella sp. Root1480D1]KQZ39890.1 nickel transporter [Duganella sp. Root1480D1]
MAHTLPDNLIGLCLLVLSLGLKHGFDPDHLATIDGLARWNMPARPRLARQCGVWFSLGHGAVVIAIAVALSTLAGYWQPPAWLELCGAWVSIACLIGLGLLNIRALLTAAAGQVVAPARLKGLFLGRLAAASRPGGVALVGALFALSFDTVSQASLFAVAATQFGGWPHAMLMGVLFTQGMLLADGVHGLWIARLLRRSGEAAVLASRIMGWVVAGVSFLVAGFGVLKLTSPTIDAWSDGKQLAFGAALVAVLAGSFLLAMAMVRPRANASSDASLG